MNLNLIWDIAKNKKDLEKLQIIYKIYVYSV
jgi:hypothetical protein